MHRFLAGQFGVEQGWVMLFSDVEDDGPMWTGQGAREVRRRVRFSEAFVRPPAVMVGLSMWDLDQATNQRGDLRAEAVAVGGFELVFSTWADTRVARIRVDWTAFGDLASDDLWDV